MRQIDRDNMMIAMKLAFFLMALTLSLFILLAATRSALAASIKDVAIIRGDVITAGDLFDGIQNNADYVLGPAPQPGKDMVLNARTLYRIASALDIAWRPQSTAQQVTVRRAATVIPTSQIEEKLAEELRASGATGDFNILANGGIEPIVLPQEAAQVFDVSDLRYEPHKDYFEATLIAPSKDNPLKKVRIAGEVERIVSLPVLKTSMTNGDIISVRDLDFVSVPVKSLPKDIILDADKITGQTPRRLATAGKPLSFNDLVPPQMVGRGETVTLVFQDGGIVVSTKGKSLQDGAMGDLIRVTNITSNKSLSGIVTGSREITVQ